MYRSSHRLTQELTEMSGGNGQARPLSLKSLDERVADLEDEREHYNATLTKVLVKQDDTAMESKLARTESEAVGRKVDEILRKIDAIAMALKFTER